MAPPGRRKEIRQILPDYIEIFCKCSLATSTQRDPKGLYLLSTLGIVTNFPSNMADYETPVSADLIVDTETSSKQVCLGEILRFLSSETILTDHK